MVQPAFIVHSPYSGHGCNSNFSADSRANGHPREIFDTNDRGDPRFNSNASANGYPPCCTNSNSRA